MQITSYNQKPVKTLCNARIRLVNLVINVTITNLYMTKFVTVIIHKIFTNDSKKQALLEFTYQ